MLRKNWFLQFSFFYKTEICITNNQGMGKCNIKFNDLLIFNIHLIGTPFNILQTQGSEFVVHVANTLAK